LDQDPAIAAQLEGALAPTTAGAYGAVKAQLCYLQGRYAEALQATLEFKPLPAKFYVPDYPFYRGLAAARLADTATGEQRETLLGHLNASISQLDAWALLGPENLAHRAALLHAELARVEGDHWRALQWFDQAIEGAQAGGFTMHQAIACEACADMSSSQGRLRTARSYLKESVWAYRRWGAAAKVRQLMALHPNLQQSALEEQESTVQGSMHSTQSATTHGGFNDLFDLSTALRAAEAISAELRLENVLAQLTRALVDNTGAQRGFVISCVNDVFTVQACLDVSGPKSIRPESSTADFAQSLVRYVARSQRAVVLADARLDATYATDPYIMRQRPRSTLCVPMLHQGKLLGVVYLENNSASNIFSAGRLELTQFIATHAAAALEHARLYGEIAEAQAGLRAANDTLEVQVAERTTELQHTLSELWSEMDLARKIQTVLLPKVTRIRNFDIAASMVAADSVGGDYYDVIEAGPSDWVMIGDVSGHGVTAGLIMMMIQTAVRSVITSIREGMPLGPSGVLSLVNRAVSRNLKLVGDGQYMTLSALELDRGAVRWSGLHQDILVYRAQHRRVDRIETDGMWIGVMDDISEVLNDSSIQLDPGDVLLLYTDGVTETRVEHGLMGTDGLAARFQELARCSGVPADIVQGILAPLGSKALADDMTLMAIRYAPDLAAE
jgi:histidine kinase